MDWHLRYLLFCVICMNISLQVKSGDIITPKILDEPENSTAIFRCSPKSIGVTIRWQRKNGTICLFMTDNCTELLSSNKSTLNCNCYKDSLNGTVVSLQITNISSADHNTSFNCMVLSLSGDITDDATLLVKVPVKTLNISPVGDNIQISENTSYHFSCNSSYSRPTPVITWIVKSKNDKTLELFGKQTNSTDTNGFTSAFNTLDYRPKRAVNGWTICCAVKKTDVQTKQIISRVIILNITYPPESKLTINGLSMKGRYYVIDNNTGTLNCSITGGNPKPILTWKKCFDDENSSMTSTLDVTKRETNTLTWRAKSHTDRNCTCQSIQMERNDSMSIDVNIMYPPSIPTVTLASLNVSDYINILLNETMLLNCDSDSKPPSTYQWRFENFSNSQVSTNKALVIQEVKKNDQGLYTCSARNTMNSTDTIKTGIGSKTIELQVLYPPSIKHLEDKSFVEGSNINISCPVFRGNPGETVFRWISERNKSWSSQFLTINNVSKNDDMKYNCTIYNTMNPTGKLPVQGKDSETFHLFVEYFATIRNFNVYGHSLQSNVTVDENENITFICNVDSNPISNTSLTLRNGDLVFWTVSNKLNYTLYSATCLDSGGYICNGKNKHNIGNDSTKHVLYLFVKCTPGANPFVPYKKNITSAKNVEAILTFPFLAYPKPDVTWQKYTNSNWTNLTSGSDIKIESSTSYINLTIYNVTELHFGQYRLIITNNIGSYTQSFSINAKDRPNSPSRFKVIKELTTDSTATIQWFPSFDGGYPQHFILNYSKANQDKWLTRQINDTGELIMNYTINGLSSDTVYYIVLQAVNSIGSSEFTETLKFQTKVSPIRKEDSVLGKIIGSISGVIGAILVTIIVILFIRKRRGEKVPDKKIYQNVPNIGRHKESKQSKRTSLIRETHFVEDGLQEVDDIPQLENERTEYYNSLDKISEIDKIRVSELFQYVLGQTEDDFAIEYQQIPTELQSSVTYARKPENIALNRYNGIFPYDHSRVKISILPDFFINACYIDGYKRRKAYIASLGPTEKTSNKFVSFWQMVWYERSDIIVMLTNLREVSGMKCEQYWPEQGNTISYGEMSVTSMKTDTFAEFTARTFTLSKGKDQRLITHLHFTAWPDKTVPEDTISLIEFRQKVKTTTTSSAGPIIVHCSAGIGRTGTLIAFDRLVAEGQDRHDVNIFECVNSMRKQRVKMVQTLEQYIYIYKALVIVLCFESEYMTVKDLRKLDGTTKNTYIKVFQQLKQTVDTPKKDEKEAINKNEKETTKNRPGADIPGNRFRVFLSLNRKYGNTDYINAVYANSFIRKDFFIMAQTPLPDTVEDFICLIYQEDCTCIVTMDDLKVSYREIGKYIPDEGHVLEIGNFKVSSSILETKRYYILRKMKICYKGMFERGERIVYHFQYTTWLAENEIPADVGNFLQFLQDVQQYACELGDERSHVLVHCLKANERSGLFCALMIIMEKLDKDGQVNISHTIRHLRTRRRSAITSMEQLQFCFQAASVFAKLLKQ